MARSTTIIVRSAQFESYEKTIPTAMTATTLSDDDDDRRRTTHNVDDDVATVRAMMAATALCARALIYEAVHTMTAYT